MTTAPATEANNDAPVLPHTCRCGTRWSGTRTAHCAAEGCHLTFTGVGPFDLHRRNGTCIDPTKVGLVDAGRAYPCWGTVNTEGATE